MKFIRAKNLIFHTDLAIQMFTDRADQFGQRLGWDVHVDRFGLERDEYDSLDPIYVIDHDENGRHLSSMRLLPSTGRTMLNDHFRHFYNGPTLSSPDIWECSRFCVARGSDRKSAPRLLAACARLMFEMSIEQLAATFGPPMERIYSMSGSVPEVIGTGLTPHGEVSVGLWQYSMSSYRKLLRVSGLDSTELELNIANSDVCNDVLKYDRSKAIRPFVHVD